MERFFVRPLPEDSIYRNRLQEELELIEQFHFTKVFQQVYYILEICRRLNIPHIIRGSAGSSLICFLMGITHMDPIAHGLELARFMNKGRKDLPDIDIDVPYNRREELYGEIAARWPNQVARISNHVRFTYKTALREATKKEILEQVPEQRELRSKEDRQRLCAVARRNFRMEALLPEKEAQESVRQEAKEKQGQLKNYSRHCGGIVIFEEAGSVPKDLTLYEATAEEPVAQLHLNKDETEDAGLIKIDVLSNRGLAQWVEASAASPFRQLCSYPQQNSRVEAIFASGDTLGITFGESRGMRRIFMELRPRHFTEVGIALALIRPAAAVDGRKAEFLERWRFGAEKSEESPLRRPILFDDDAILLIQEALDCSAAEADRWRKVFAKDNPRGRVDFRLALQRCSGGKDTIPRDTQDILVSNLEKLALYSFCRSHALSYAQLVWALAYEKAHQPHAFWCAALNHCHSEYRKWVYYREARCAGLLLSRSPPPYRVGQRGGQPALVAVRGGGEQTLLAPQHPLQEFQELGYWCSEDFLSCCYLEVEPQMRLTAIWGNKGPRESSQEVRFCGLIANGRVLRRDGDATFLTIGVANGRYIDCVIANQARHDILGYAFVRGSGWLKTRGKQETLEITKIAGVSAAKLRERQHR